MCFGAGDELLESPIAKENISEDLSRPKTISKSPQSMIAADRTCLNLRKSAIILNHPESELTHSPSPAPMLSLPTSFAAGLVVSPRAGVPQMGADVAAKVRPARQCRFERDRAARPTPIRAAPR